MVLGRLSLRRVQRSPSIHAGLHGTHPNHDARRSRRSLERPCGPAADLPPVRPSPKPPSPSSDSGLYGTSEQCLRQRQYIYNQFASVRAWTANPGIRSKWRRLRVKSGRVAVKAHAPIHGSSFTLLLCSITSSMRASAAGFPRSKVSTNPSRAPKVPGFGTTCFTTAENDSLPERFHDFSRA